MSVAHSLVYACLKPWVKLGARLFFNRIEIVGLENIPDNKPIILIANHQNAMMDPVICCTLVPRQLHWLTRADVFKNPIANRLLRNLNMLPVFRERDKVDNLLGKNEKTFAECYQRLNEKAIICLFPEGTHRGKKQLVVPLKKGLARLALGAFDQCPDVHIVPVGLEYSAFDGYFTQLLLVVGKATPVADYIKEANGDTVKAISLITQDQRKKLGEVMIDIEDDQSYDALLALQPWIHQLYPDSLMASFEHFKEVTAQWQKEKDVEQNNHSVLRFQELSNTLKIDPKSFSKGNVWFFFGAPMLLVLALPYILLSLTVFGSLYYFIERFVHTKLKDPLFYNSIRLCFWTFLSPLVALGSAAIFSMVLSSTLSFFAWLVCIVFSGVVTIHALPLWKKWKSAARWRKNKNNGQREWNEWAGLYKKWSDYISEFQSK